MRPHLLRLTTLTVLLGLSAAACGVEPVEGALEPTTLQGEVSALDGTTIDLGDLEGQDVVFWFWAPW